MKAIALVVVMLAFGIGSIYAFGKDTAPIALKRNDHGKMGAIDSSGKIVIPFMYQEVRQISDEFFLIAQTTKISRYGHDLSLGVVTKQNQQIIPPKYFSIEYVEDKQRFKVSVRRSGVTKFGYLDFKGRTIVPIVYDAIESSSNSGQESTKLVTMNGKRGYIDIVSGRLLIKPEYESLLVDPRLTDGKGRGIVVAAKRKRWGVLSTEGEVIVPFEFDRISEISPRNKTALAERKGKLVLLAIDGAKYAVSEEVPNQYSSTFLAKSNPRNSPGPFDGLYVTETYPTMKSAWDGWHSKKLRWAAIPSMQIDGTRAYVSFGMFANARLPLMPSELEVKKQDNGFVLMNADTRQSAPTTLFTFVAKDSVLYCDACEKAGIPHRWRLAEPAKLTTFVGIGVVLKNKVMTVDEFIRIKDVLNGSPADKAGLQKGDLIFTIDGTEVADLTSTEQATQIMRGRAGSRISMVVRRPGDVGRRTLEVERQVMQVSR